MSFIYFEEKHIDHKRADVLSLKKMINLSSLSRAPELCNGLDIDRYVFELLRQMSEQKMNSQTTLLEILKPIMRMKFCNRHYCILFA